MRRFTDEELTERVINDTAILEVARGWVGLKLYREAVTELSKASEFSKTRFDFMEIRSQIHTANSQWQELLESAEAMIIEEPDNEFGFQFRAEAIRHLKNAQAAYENLAHFVGKFPNSPFIRFNLACFASVSGNFFSARRHLIQMFRLADKTGEVNYLQNLALDDDLMVLWPEISRMMEAAERLDERKSRLVENRLEHSSSNDTEGASSVAPAAR
jgi:hypothetical protein